MKPRIGRRLTNMYPLSAKQWSPFVGCKHECLYCKPSFQRLLKIWSSCPSCKIFIPHYHSTRLKLPLPKTRYMQFIFTCSNGDVAFCDDSFFIKILEKIKREKDKNFLIQSKDPKQAFLDRNVRFPSNLVLGTTIETNANWLYKKSGISKAPSPSKRFEAMFKVAKIHQPIMLTCEPILDFDHKIMVDCVEKLKPCMIWIGYDSKNCKMPEPAMSKTVKLATDLMLRGYVVILKRIRKAWWEDKIQVKRASHIK